MPLGLQTYSTENSEEPNFSFSSQNAGSSFLRKGAKPQRRKAMASEWERESQNTLNT